MNKLSSAEHGMEIELSAYEALESAPSLLFDASEVTEIPTNGRRVTPRPSLDYYDRLDY